MQGRYRGKLHYTFLKRTKNENVSTSIKPSGLIQNNDIKLSHIKSRIYLQVLILTNG